MQRKETNGPQLYRDVQSPTKLRVWQSRALRWVLLPICTVISVCFQTLLRGQNWPCHGQASLLLQAQEHSLLRNPWNVPMDGEGVKFSPISPPPRDEGWSCKTSCQTHWEVVCLQATQRKMHFSHWGGAPRIRFGGIFGEGQHQWCIGATTGRGSR